MQGDPWLERWLPLIGERAGPGPVLELGCGTGRDTATLIGAGHRVVAFDRSSAFIAEARARCPTAESHCRDILAPFPVAGVGVIVASLSMHYFTWPQTLALAARVRDTLRPSGVLLCRLNSTNDAHYGANGHPEIEPGLFLVDGEPKRFFDRAAVTALFAQGWTTLAMGEFVIDRYEHPKAAWEIVLEKAGA